MEKTNVIVIGIGAVVAIGVSVMIVAGSNGSTDPTASNGSLQGLQETEAPWQPEYKFLAQRIEATKIPPPGRETYHVHARLHVYVDGKQTPVPMNIGLNPQARLTSALHTHDAEGIVHIEADAPRDVKLSEFFTIWGVKFTKDQLGAYKNQADKTLQVFVNEKPVEDFENYLIKPKDEVIVGYGSPGSFPTKPPKPFPEGL